MTEPLTPQERKIALFYQDGSSDKEYHLHLIPKDGQWMVQYKNGRRGGTLRHGDKTATPVEFAIAQACYEKELKKKLKEGYTPTEGGVVFQDTEREQAFTGIVPQLLNPIDEDDAEGWIKNKDSFGQEKHDGERRILSIADQNVTGINRSGLAVPVLKSVEKACLGVKAKSWIGDGEDMGNHIVLFDLLEVDGVDLRGKSARDRLKRLKELVQDSDILRVTHTAYTEAEKRALIKEVMGKTGEGVVFKLGNAAYVPGRPASGGSQVKFKFYETATMRVRAGRPTKRSVGIEAMDDAGQWTATGNVTIPPNKDIPAPETLIEVRYLYAYEGGSLYQPTFLHPRNDLGDDACVMSQLKYKRKLEAPEPAAKVKRPKAA